jgi:hypothetical protein
VRWYEPELGCFLSPDPVEFKAGNIFLFSRYSYANSNPRPYVDADGRQSEDFKEENHGCLQAACQVAIQMLVHVQDHFLVVTRQHGMAEPDRVHSLLHARDVHEILARNL